VNRLDVFIEGRLVGTVDAVDRRSVRFEYDTAYVSQMASTRLSVSMPLRATRYSHATASPYLWGLLPDNDRVLTRWGREFGCSASDVVGLLGGVGTDVAGAAQYLLPGVVPSESSPGSIEWLTDRDVEQFLRDVRRDTSAWRPNAEGCWSLAGAQPKIALLYNPDSKRWGLPSGQTPTTHILKPAIDGLDDFDINEHLCLATARNLGLRAAMTTVQSFGNQRVLVVERYDRIRAGDSIRRVHQEDMCQALGVHPDQKYESDGGPGSADIAAVVREFCGPGDASRLFDAMAYNWLVLATDGHAKNYSLLHSAGQTRLAPLYDIASATPHLHHRKAALAQAIGGERRAFHIRRRHWERAAPAFGIAPDEAIDRISDLAVRLPDALSAAVAQSDFSRTERRIAHSIADMIVAWTKSAQLTIVAAAHPKLAAPPAAFAGSSKRPIRTGRTDTLGRPIKVSHRDIETRATAPPPSS